MILCKLWFGFKGLPNHYPISDNGGFWPKGAVSGDGDGAWWPEGALSGRHYRFEVVGGSGFAPAVMGRWHEFEKPK